MPAEVRRRLGGGPGSMLEWNDDGKTIIVRRVGRFTSEDVHRALFSVVPRTRKLTELKEGIAKYVRRRRARR